MSEVPSLFQWSVGSQGDLRITFSEDDFLSVGPAAEKLERLEVYDFQEFLVPEMVPQGKGKPAVLEDVPYRMYYPNRRANPLFYWKEQPSCFETESTAHAERRRSREFAAGANLLARLSSLCNMRLDPLRGWRALSPNPCVHFQFGPCVAAATDGSRVILLNEAKLELPFFIAHRQNIWGCVSGTPTPVDCWDYYSNWGKTKRKGPTTTELATKILEELLKA